MMRKISNNLALIINLNNTAQWHAAHCTNSCNVSIRQIKEVADKLAENIPFEEQEEFNKLEWPSF